MSASHRPITSRAGELHGQRLLLRGEIEEEPRELFIVAVGKSAHEKHKFQAGDDVSGESEPVVDERTEVAELYKTAKLKVFHRPPPASSPPPWTGAPPPALDVYRARGHRRLATKTYEDKCTSCVWGAKMAVEMIIDQWDQSKVRYRVETFCYGPKSCKLYRAGPTRKVPGRKGMSWEGEDWVDDEETAHRADDE